VVIVPLLPGLAHAVTPDNVYIDTGLQHLYSINYLYGFSLSVTFYFALNYFWPHRRTLIPAVVPGVFAARLSAVDLDIETTIMEGKMVRNLEKFD
jgi:nucleobase:cation symporter-1, NCS1 family